MTKAHHVSHAIVSAVVVVVDLFCGWSPRVNVYPAPIKHNDVGNVFAANNQSGKKGSSEKNFNSI